MTDVVIFSGSRASLQWGVVPVILSLVLHSRLPTLGELLARLRSASTTAGLLLCEAAIGLLHLALYLWIEVVIVSRLLVVRVTSLVAAIMLLIVRIAMTGLSLSALVVSLIATVALIAVGVEVL